MPCQSHAMNFTFQSGFFQQQIAPLKSSPMKKDESRNTEVLHFSASSAYSAVHFSAFSAFFAVKSVLYRWPRKQFRASRISCILRSSRLSNHQSLITDH